MAAAREGRAEEVGRLLRLGVSPNSRDTIGRGLLHQAAVAESVTVMKLLLDAGASIEGRDAIGATPLVEAAWAGSAISVDYLLQNGAHPDGPGTGSDLAPLERVMGGWHIAPANGASVESDLHPDFPRRRIPERVRIVQSLLTAGADPNRGIAFELALYENSVTVVHLLLDHGADPRQVAVIDSFVDQGGELGDLLRSAMYVP